MKYFYITVFFVFTLCFLQASAIDDLNLAKDLMEQRALDEAFLQVNYIITEYPFAPESYEARLILADIHLQRELYQEARIQLLLLLRNPFLLTFEQRAKTYSQLGLVLSREKQYTAAIEMYDKLFLDYKNTSEAQKSFTAYFDCFFALGDYQSVIVKTRELIDFYRNDEVLAELLYHQANAYFIANMTAEATRVINDIRTKYSGTMAAWRAYELQVLLHEREQGKQSARELLEEILAQPIARIVEENLSWLLVHYYIDLGETASALEKIDYIVSRFTLSENISLYHLLWLQLLTDDMNIRPILANEEYIISASRNKPEYHSIVYYIAKTRFIAQDYWTARNYLDTNINNLTDDFLIFDYKFLSAEILMAQGQYVNSIDIFNSLINQYSHIGKNFDVLMKLGDIYLLYLNQEGQALSFYRRATNLALTVNQSIKAHEMTALCLQQLGQFSEALLTLNQIPIDSIEDNNQKELITNRITLFYIFLVSDPQTAQTHYLKLNMLNRDLSIIDNATLLAINLKEYEAALDLLSTQNNYEIRMERIKINYLLAYKSLLENNQPDVESYLAAANRDISQLGTNINPNDRAFINTFQNFIASRGKITPSNLENVINYTSSSILNENVIDLRNFFRFQLWKYYNDSNNTEEIILLAPSIIQDAFVGILDYQRVNVRLASYFYEIQDYEQAINHFSKADRFLNLSYAEYYYQYAMCLYETRQTMRALEILQRLVLNNPDNEALAPARDLIVNYWITNNRLPDALDILNQIPPLKKEDADYRNTMKIYNLLNDPQKEKDALLFIKQKTIIDLQRLANLYLLTGDKISAEATWRDILRLSEDSTHKLNSYAGLGNLFYIDEKYTEANRNYDEYFKIFTRNTPSDELLIQPVITLKEHIISCLMTNNRPKAETAQKNFSFLINNDHDFLAEIKLYEGIYYVKMEPRRAERPLTQVIEDGKISAELAYKALFWRGTLYLQEKKTEQAETDLLSALHTTDEKLKNQVRLKLGTLYFSQENFEEALGYYYDVILNDQDGDLAKDAAHNFAITARTIQQWNIAIAAYQIIMDRWGQGSLEIETKLTIGFSFYMAKEYDQAINLLNQLFPDLRTLEHRAEAQFWIAESQLKKGEYENAEEGFRQIKTTFRVARWIELADLKIAETYIYRGDIDRGKTLLNEVIRSQGANSDAGKEATRLLQEYSN